MRMILQTICKTVVYYVQTNISQSNFYLCFCLQDFLKVARLCLGAVSIDGLNNNNPNKNLWV